jgi:hypothetical protein
LLLIRSISSHTPYVPPKWQPVELWFHVYPLPVRKWNRKETVRTCFDFNQMWEDEIES